MNLVDWLKRRAPADDLEAPNAFLPASGREVSAPLDEDTPEELEAPDENGSVILEPIFSTIDYVDAAGRESRRRITLRSLHTGNNGPILRAICHERRALRCFRIDRIECFIEPDGEVVEADDFLRETLFIDPSKLIQPESPSKEQGRPGRPRLGSEYAPAQAARERLRSPLSILVLAARADDEFHPEELDVICCWAERELIIAAKEERIPPPSIDMLDRLNGLIGRMRPHQRTLPDHLKNVLLMPDDRFNRFEGALRDVILADGGVDEAEIQWIEELSVARAQAQRGRAFDLSEETEHR